jgi:hypothetical protein
VGKFDWSKFLGGKVERPDFNKDTIKISLFPSPPNRTLPNMTLPNLTSIPVVDDAMLRVYREQIEKYKEDANHYADSLRYGMSQARYALPGLFPKEKTMGEETPIFAVYKAANGFYAKLKSGKIVVGSTMSSVCADVSAAIADEIVREEQMSVVQPKAGPWQKVD